MAQRFQALAIASVFLGICFPRPAQGDVITVTAGQAVLGWQRPVSRAFSGTDGFELGGTFGAAPTSPQRVCLLGCAAGTNLDLSAVFGGTPEGPLGSILFPATVNGITYMPFRPGLYPGLSLRGSLVFDAPIVVLPPLADFVLGSPFTAPFTFHGHVGGFESGNNVFEVDLTGHGTAEMSFSTDGTRYTTPRVTYVFESANPIPEPTSVLLLGTGLAGVLVRRRIPQRTFGHD